MKDSLEKIKSETIELEAEIEGHPLSEGIDYEAVAQKARSIIIATLKILKECDKWKT